MEKAHDAPLTVGEIAARLKCARGWAQLTIDAGCPVDDSGRVSMRDFMLFQLGNIHRVRELAGLPAIGGGASGDELRRNVKAVLTTQLEWLQHRSTRASVKTAARLVRERIDAMSGL